MKKILTLVFLHYLLIACSSYAQGTGDYRSRSSGNWANASTWETYNGNSWVVASTSPLASSFIGIQDPHVVILSGGTVSADLMIVEGTLDFEGGILMIISSALINNGGTLNLNGGILSINSVSGNEVTIKGEFNFLSGRIYSDGGVTAIAGSAFRWSSGSIHDNVLINLMAGSTFQFRTTGGKALHDNARLKNFTTLVNTDSSCLFVNGPPGTTPVVENYGIWNFDFGSRVSMDLTSGAAFHNYGVINKNTANTNSVISGPAGMGIVFSNPGTVNVNEGSLELYGLNMQQHTGRYFIEAGAFIQGGGNVDIPYEGDTIVCKGEIRSIKFTLTGSTTQYITGGGIIENFVMNSAAKAELLDHFTVNRSIEFQIGKLFLGNYDLILDNPVISGGNANSYAVTDGTGKWIDIVYDNELSFFEVGTATHYMPASYYTHESSVEFDTFYCQLKPNLYDAYDGNGQAIGAQVTSNAVDAVWLINKGDTSETTMELTLQWNGQNELPNLDKNACGIAFYNGLDWEQNDLSAAQGTDPYTMSSACISQFRAFAVVDNAALNLRESANKLEILNKQDGQTWGCQSGKFTVKHRNNLCWSGVLIKVIYAGVDFNSVPASIFDLFELNVVKTDTFYNTGADFDNVREYEVTDLKPGVYAVVAVEIFPDGTTLGVDVDFETEVILPLALPTGQLQVSNVVDASGVGCMDGEFTVSYNSPNCWKYMFLIAVNTSTGQTEFGFLVNPATSNELINEGLRWLFGMVKSRIPQETDLQQLAVSTIENSLIGFASDYLNGFISFDYTFDQLGEGSWALFGFENSPWFDTEIPITISVTNPNIICCQTNTDCPLSPNPCFQNVCVNGICTLQPVVICPPSADLCSTNVCVNGVCVLQPIIVCPPSIDPCSTNVCVNGGCVLQPICPLSSDPCSTNVCVNGGCVLQPICPPSADPCSTNVCVNGGCVLQPLCLPSVDPCSTNVCVNGGCVLQPVCPPSTHPCSTNVCVNGVCTQQPIACDDGNPCNGIETCDPISSCLPGTAPTEICGNGLDDDCNPLTSDICSGGGGGTCYAILATKKVTLSQSQVLQGGVGVNGAGNKAVLDLNTVVTAPGTFVKADDIQVINGSTVTLQLLSPANATLMNFEASTSSNQSQNVNVPAGTSITLNGSEYKNISLGVNSIATFTQPVINAKQIHAGVGSILNFTQCSRIRLSNSLVLSGNNTFNAGSNEIEVFVDGNVMVGNPLSPATAGSIINVRCIYSNGNITTISAIPAVPNEMSGLFICSKLISGEFTNWSGPCIVSPCAYPPVLARLSNVFDNKVSSELILFPNPASNDLVAKFYSGSPCSYSIHLLDASGRIVIKKTGVTSKGENLIEFDVSALSKGIYMVRLITNETAELKRVVIQ